MIKYSCKDSVDRSGGLRNGNIKWRYKLYVLFWILLTINACTPMESVETTNIHIHEYEESVKFAATCAVEGELEEICKTCGDVVVKIVPTTGEHVWDEGEILKEATCAFEGKKQYSCIVCKEKRQETILATGNHMWNAGEITREATCIAEGDIKYTCEVCKQTNHEVIPATNEHILNSGEVKKEATCNEEGEIIFECTTCDYCETSNIPFTGEHKWSEGNEIKKATCITEGQKEYKCLVCGMVKTDMLPKKTTHTWDEGMVIKEATYNSKGTRTFTCKICGETKSESIPIKKPNASDYTVIPIKPVEIFTATPFMLVEYLGISEEVCYKYMYNPLASTDYSYTVPIASEKYIARRSLDDEIVIAFGKVIVDSATNEEWYVLEDGSFVPAAIWLEAPFEYSVTLKDTRNDLTKGIDCFETTTYSQGIYSSSEIRDVQNMCMALYLLKAVDNHNMDIDTGKKIWTYKITTYPISQRGKGSMTHGKGKRKKK